MLNLNIIILISYFVVCWTPELLAQKLTLSPYIGREAEIITETQGLLVGDATLIPSTQANYVWTPGLKLDYILNEKFRFGLDAVYRPFYSYTYSIYIPYVKSPTGYISSGSGRAVNELSISIIPQMKVWQINDFQVWVAIGGGSTFPFVRRGGARNFDFGEGQESLTTIFNNLRLHPHKVIITGQASFLVSWKRLFLQLRYLRTLSRSATDPLAINGRSYPYINKRDGLGISAGLSFPIGGNKKIDGLSE